MTDFALLYIPLLSNPGQIATENIVKFLLGKSGKSSSLTASIVEMLQLKEELDRLLAREKLS